MRSHDLSAKDFCEMNVVIGKSFAGALQTVCQDHAIDVSSIDVVGSHGQTIYHQVESNRFIKEDQNLIRSTLQIGEASEIAMQLGVNVVSNFRTNDVSLGGQGAPLTSIFDFLMLRHATSWRAIQNIGGIGNVTFVPPLDVGEDVDPSSLVVSFDTGPGNSLIDDCIRIVSNGTMNMDTDGEWGRRGNCHPKFFSDLCNSYNPYFEMDYPKTTGRELFGRDQVEKWIDQRSNYDIDNYSLVSTFTELTAYSIVKSYEMVCKKSNIQSFEVVVAGGGQNNPYLMERIAHLLKETFQRTVPVFSHENLNHEQALNSNAKEGMLFALLAYLHEKQRPSNIPNVTGAIRCACLGSKTVGKFQ